MRRVLFQFGGIKIHAYPAMLYLGVVFGVIAGTDWATLHGLDSNRVFAAMLLLVLPALLGARLLFVVCHWELYRREPSRIWQRSDGGAALYGGLLVSFFASLPLLGLLGIPLAKFWDAAAITLMVGMILTRVGCLLNGCCAGRPTERWFALYLPDVHGVWRRRLPTQLLEAGFAALLLFGSVEVWNRLPFDGALFLSALAAYGAGRLWLESTREKIHRIGRVSIHRAISAIVVGLSTTSFLFNLFLSR